MSSQPLAALGAALSSLQAAPWQVQLAAALGAALGGLIALAAWNVRRELRKPAPKEGTPYKLPNGMTIMHWNPIETDFLYDEIFGPESPYNRGGQLKFAPGQTIVDAGANIGMFTLFAAKATSGHARIVSFEPIPSTHAVLAANAAAATRGDYQAWLGAAPGAALDISPFKLGLSDAPGRVTFEHSPHLSIWSAKDEEFVEARRQRFVTDIMRSLDTSPNALIRWCLPRWLGRWLTTAFIGKFAATEPVDAELVTLSSMIDKLGLGTIDLLKVDVEGSEEAVLRGITEAHWPRIQQLVLEVENFAAVASITATLQARGFRVVSFATEREKNPAATSEVSMMYAARPGYAPGAPSSAAPARPRSASRGRSPSAAASAKKAAGKAAASPSPSASARKRR